MRALVVGGAMIVACQDARDARASRADSARVVAKGVAASHGAVARDSTGFSVPAVCAQGGLPVPRKAARVATAPKTRADSVKQAKDDSMHMAALSLHPGAEPAHLIGGWRDSSGAADSSTATRADTMRVARAASTDSISGAPKSPRTAHADSVARARAKVHADSLKVIALQTDSAATRRLPGSLFPGCRVVAYYGNPMSKRMGILGEINPDSMLARLAKQAAAYAAVDSGRPVLPALELIATVAQAGPGKSGLYRARMPDTLIARVMGWAEKHHYLVILDIQTGRSTMAAEMAPLMKYLAKPYVHLALDPEFSIGTKKIPGKVIGRIDAADVNAVSTVLAALVDSLKLPPKMLIVHRFTTPMLSNHQKIKLDPRVQIVIDMDGFGPPRLKYGSYKAYVHDRPVQFAGFKLFYKNDKPILTPAQVMELDPVPLFIMYQ
ncbi:MAG: hypothetical protein M3Y05_01265 [Gemmatimonadota bacterium]|nr:hypothetical protein [Gemmatimonadota bacterium]